MNGGFARCTYPRFDEHISLRPGSLETVILLTGRENTLAALGLRQQKAPAKAGAVDCSAGVWIRSRSCPERGDLRRHFSQQQVGLDHQKLLHHAQYYRSEGDPHSRRLGMKCGLSHP